MMFDCLQVALESDPKKKGIALFRVASETGGVWWVWARSARDALGLWASSQGAVAHKYRAGVVVESNLSAPSIQEALFDGTTVESN